MPIIDKKISGYPQFINCGTDSFSIPREYSLAEWPLNIDDDQLINLVLSLWREYLLHDEVMSAYNLLLNAPYRIRDKDIIVKALNETAEMFSHLSSAKKNSIINTPHDPNGNLYDREVTTEFPGNLSGQVYERYKWITDRLNIGDRIIDFGCIDGTMTNRWSNSGFDVTGVDLSINSINIARDVAKSHSLRVKYINSYFNKIPELVNKDYTVVTCSDTYEHFSDPVSDLLKPARSILRHDGRLLLVTPNGSWTRGYFLDWCYPFRWVGEHGTFTPPVPHGHLIAPSVRSVVSDISRAGFRIKDAHVLNQPINDVVGQSNVCVEAHVPVHAVGSVGSIASFGELKDAERLCSLGYNVVQFIGDTFSVNNFVFNFPESYINCGFIFDLLISDHETGNTSFSKMVSHNNFDISNLRKFIILCSYFCFFYINEFSISTVKFVMNDKKSPQKPKAQTAQTTAKKAVDKKGPSKAELVRFLSGEAGLTKRQINSMLAALSKFALSSFKKGSSLFVIPDVVRLSVKNIPAKPERTIRNPATGLQMKIPARGPSKKLIALPVKKLRGLLKQL